MIPYGEKIKEIWNAFIMLLTVFAGIEIPFRMVVSVRNEGLFYWIDLSLSIFFFLDILVNLFSSETQSDKQEPYFLNREYIRTWFFIDFLAAIPFSHSFFGGMFETQGFKILRLVRLVRLLKLAKIVPLIKRWNYLRTLNPSLVRMSLFFGILILVAHWMACGWIALGTELEKQDPLSAYVRAIYWVITTMTTVGYGDITPKNNFQIVYAVLIMILGVGTYGYVIANLSSYFGNIDTARSDFTRKMGIINAFLVYREIPPELENRIRSYYNYIWDNRLDHNEEEVIGELPDSLKLDVKLYLRQPLISKVPLFQKASPEFRNEMVNYLQIHVFMPGDFIVKKGEPGNSIYFVSRGSVEILDDEMKTLAVIGEGSFFGETSLLLEQPRNATVKAHSFCNVYSLDKKNFEHLLSKYPQFKQEIEKMSSLRSGK